MSTGQKVSLHPVNGNNGLAQMASQINGAFSRVERAINQKMTTQLLYDTDHATTRVLLGKVSGKKDYVLAISKDGVDVVRALAEDKIDRSKFIFHSTIINKRLDDIDEEIENIVEQSEKMLEIVQLDIEAFEAILSGMSGIEGANTSGLSSKVAQLKIKKAELSALVEDLRELEDRLKAEKTL